MSILKLLADVLKESPEACAFEVSFENVLAKLEREYKAFYDEIYIKSADKTISKWEKMCALPSVPSKSIEERRSAVLAKIRRAGTCTPQKIKEIALSFECGDISIKESFGEHKVTIKLISKIGIPPRMNEFKAETEAAMPAHLLTNYEYTYRRWGEYSDCKWGDLAPYTWEGIRNMEVLP